MVQSMHVYCIIMLVLMLPTCLLANSMKDLIKKVDIDGEVAIGLQYVQKPKPKGVGGKPYDEEFKRIGNLEADFKIKPTSSIFLGFELRYEIDQSSVEVPKLYGGVKLTKEQNILGGYLKKKVSMESLIPSHERLFAKKSLKSQYLNSFNVLGYDLTLAHKFKTRTQKNRKIKTWVAMGGDPSFHFFLNASGLIIGEKFSFSSGLILMHAKMAQEKQNYFIASSAVRTEFSELYQISYEVTSGLDPNATIIAKEIGVKNEVYFCAQRMEQSFSINTHGHKLSLIEPVFENSLIFNDLGTWKANLELRPGLNFYFGRSKRLRWMFNLIYSYVTVAPSFNTLSRLEQGCHTEVQICW